MSTRPNETREMRLFSRTIELYRKIPDTSLPQFIARRREPGDGWMSWAELIYDLRAPAGVIVSEATMRKWARAYGIPEYTEGNQPSAKNRFSEKAVPADQYAEALTAAGITL